MYEAFPFYSGELGHSPSDKALTMAGSAGWGVAPRGHSVTHTLTNSRGFVPVFPAWMIATTGLALLCVLAGLTVLSLFVSTSLMAWRTKAYEVVIVVRAT